MIVCVFPPAVAGSHFSAHGANLPEQLQLFWGEWVRLGTWWDAGAVHLGVEKEQELMSQWADMWCSASAPNAHTGTGAGKCQAAGFKWEAKTNLGNFVLMHFLPKLSLHFIWIQILLNSNVAKLLSYETWMCPALPRGWLHLLVDEQSPALPLTPCEGSVQFK